VVIDKSNDEQTTPSEADEIWLETFNVGEYYTLDDLTYNMQITTEDYFTDYANSLSDKAEFWLKVSDIENPSSPSDYTWVKFRK